jgi:hypothetical protein
MSEEKKADLFDKFKTMSEEDLRGYESAGKFMNRICTIGGVASIFTMLAVPTITILGSGIILVYIMAQIASAATETLKHVRKNLERFETE